MNGERVSIENLSVSEISGYVVIRFGKKEFKVFKIT